MINKESNFSSFVTAVKQTGDNANLVDGELMVVTTQNPLSTGLRHATNLNVPKNQKYFKIEVGSDKRVNSRSYVYGAGSTQFFALEDIKEVRVARPVSNEVKVDEWVIGYNGGADLTTGIDFTTSDKNFTIVMELDGGSMPWRGGNTNMEKIIISEPVGNLLPFNSCLDEDPCTPLPCKPIIDNLIERMKERQAGGGYKLKEILEITPIYSCDNPIGEDEFTFYTLENCDLGDAQSLAIIQSQTDTPVFRIGRRGSISIYQTMVPTAEPPADVEITFRSIMAECDECPAEYTLVAGGYIYSFTINDDGATLAPTIPGAVGGTMVRQGGSDNIGTYTVKTTALLNATQLTTLQTTYPTMRIDLVGEAMAICAPDADPVEISWIEGDTCQASTKQFTIDLKDPDCGGDYLEELQAAYPEYTVELAPASELTSSLILLTGTSGTATVTIDGDPYLATFATDLTTTATNFVTLHGTALADLGITVTSAGGILKFVVPTALGNPTIANTATNLTGIVSTAGAVPKTAYSVTLTGTSGTANVAINSVNYLATFTTNLTTSANNFVTTHSATLAGLGIAVVANAGVLTFSIPNTLGAPTIANVVTNLAGTVSGALVSIAAIVAAGIGCRNQYLITVPTNITCEECSPVFRDLYSADRPQPFLDVEWKDIAESTPSVDCACGIRIRAKLFTLDPDMCLMYKVPFIEDSVSIKVAAGFAVEGYEGYVDMAIAGNDFKTVNVERTSLKKGRDMLAGNLRDRENESSIYFQGFPKEESVLRRRMLGRESVMFDNFTQMVEYQIVMNPSKYTQGFGHTDNGNDLSYSYLIPLGDEAPLETELFRLAAAANAPIVQAN